MRLCVLAPILVFLCGVTPAGAQAVVSPVSEIPDIGPCASVRFSPAGGLIYSYDGTQERNPPQYCLRVWDARDLKPLYSFSDTEGYPSFSRDDKVVLTTDGNGKAFLRDSHTGRLLHEFRHVDSSPPPALSPDGTRVLTLADAVCLWDAGTGRLLKKLGPHCEHFDDLRFSADGKRFLAAEFTNKGDRVYHVVNVSTDTDVFPPIKLDWDRPLATSKGYHPVGWSPDSHRLVICGSNWFQTYDADTGRYIALSDPEVPVNPHCVAFAGDGKKILIFSGRRIQLFDVETGKPLSPGIPFDHYLVAFPNFEPSGLSPDGTLLACAGQTRKVNGAEPQSIAELWDLRTGKRIQEFNGDVVSFAFSPDGTRLVACESGKRATVWAVHPNP